MPTAKLEANFLKRTFADLLAGEGAASLRHGVRNYKALLYKFGYL